MEARKCQTTKTSACTLPDLPCGASRARFKCVSGATCDLANRTTHIRESLEIPNHGTAANLLHGLSTYCEYDLLAYGNRLFGDLRGLALRGGPVLKPGQDVRHRALHTSRGHGKDQGRDDRPRVVRPAPPFLAQFQGLGKRLAAQGYLVVLPSYFYKGDPNQASLDPKIHLKTLTDALEYATKQPGADDQNIALIGFSLGGGLSLALAESYPTGRIKALVDFYGPTNPNILGGAAKLPPTLILHNKTDGIVLISNSQNLDAALGKNLITHRFKIYVEHNPDPMMKDHPFAPNGPADKDSQEQTIKWLAEYLRP